MPLCKSPVVAQWETKVMRVTGLTGFGKVMSCTDENPMDHGQINLDGDEVPNTPGGRRWRHRE